MRRYSQNTLQLAKVKRKKLFTANKRIALAVMIILVQIGSGLLLLPDASILLKVYMLSTDLILLVLALPHFDNYIMGQRPYNRIAALRRNGGSHTEQEWFKLKRRYGYCCMACGKEETKQEPLTKDHIIPVFSGGTDHISNIQPLCRSCNASKGTKIIDYR